MSGYTCPAVVEIPKTLDETFVRLFLILAQFPFTTNETELDYRHKKMNVRVSSQVIERLITFKGKWSTGHPKF